MGTGVAVVVGVTVGLSVGVSVGVAGDGTGVSVGVGDTGMTTPTGTAVGARVNTVSLSDRTVGSGVADDDRLAGSTLGTGVFTTLTETAACPG